MQQVRLPTLSGMDDTRQLLHLDRLIGAFDGALRTLAAPARAQRSKPQPSFQGGELAEADARLSAALMRVNHVGEVCAQALYAAQALTSRSPLVAAQLQEAAQEEIDHLAWTQERIAELGGRPSLLLPLWWGGAFGLGLAAGLAGDEWSLGFVVETERQVEAHLASHLERLPPEDTASRAIVEQMKADEAAHAELALSQGARLLPEPMKLLMRGAAKLMTATAHHV
jgi:ubiquinone biosynthesis monooxygenase Coq7